MMRCQGFHLMILYLVAKFKELTGYSITVRVQTTKLTGRNIKQATRIFFSDIYRSIPHPTTGV